MTVSTGERDTASAALTLLLIDDDPANLMTLAALFEDEGFAIETADSCAAARTRLASGVSYAAVLLDGTLGDGRGLDLVPSIRSTHRDAPIVLVSGAVSQGSDRLLVDAAVSKGDDFGALLVKVRALLAR